ncbi:MAG: hypothetical protein HYZ26_04535 [Chloroflexi bacterium]|nr:hypothetical protein [Chloroflexota bacterium]
MCDVCGLPEYAVQRNFALIYYTSTSWSSPGTYRTRTDYRLEGKAVVSVCDSCIEKRYAEDMGFILQWRRVMFGLALLWLLALILVLTGIVSKSASGDPTIVHYFVMPGGLILVLIGVYPFSFTKKNSIDQMLQSVALKVVPRKVAQLDTLDPIHFLVWTEEEWEKRVRESQREK